MEQPCKTILVATHNKGKIPELIENLDLRDYRFLTLDEATENDAPQETGVTYEENARIKALAARQSQPTLMVLADDSGIEVDALGGLPGIHSARFAGEGAADTSNVEKLLGALQAVPEPERTARFVCTIVCIDEDGREIVTEGVCEGRIAYGPRGSNGFGYDPVFLPDEISDGRTMAELSFEEKNRISHRGKALRALRRILLAQLQPQTNSISIAAFDFDDTVLEGRSPVRMVRRFSFKRVIPFSTGLKILWWAIRYKLHFPVEQEVVRECLFSAFTHLPAEEANKIMADFYHESLQRRLRPRALETIREHKAAGDKIVFVSASFSPILKEVKKDVEADWYICTQMEIVDGRYTSNVAHVPPEGEQKLIQLTKWADREFGESNWVLSVAYGDHRSDAPLLAAAKRAVAVNPDLGLERIAKRSNWEIVDWSFKVK